MMKKNEAPDPFWTTRRRRQGAGFNDPDVVMVMMFSLCRDVFALLTSH